MEKTKILLAGESWFISMCETKGFDNFYIGGYETGVEWIRGAFENNNFEFTHIPSHLAPHDFPDTPEALAEYDVVLLSDIGKNTMLLHPDTFHKSIPTNNKLKAIAQYVEDGGGFGMIGGYLSFTGFEGKGCYRDSVIEGILPVYLLPYDDRIETPEGSYPQIEMPESPILKGIEDPFPFVLGYNRLIPKDNAIVPISCENNPFVAMGNHGKGRTIAVSTDCGPHWVPPSFCEWEGFNLFWQNLALWLSGKI